MQEFETFNPYIKKHIIAKLQTQNKGLKKGYKMEINFNSGWTILGLIVGLLLARYAVKKLLKTKRG